MSRLRKQSEPLEDEFTYKPSLQEAREVINDMAKYPVQIINGRKQYPFEQYLEAKGIVRFGKNGERIVRDPVKYTQMSELESLVRWQQEKDQEQLFETMPEEREAYEGRLQVMFKEVKTLLRDMSSKMRVVHTDYENALIEPT